MAPRRQPDKVMRVSSPAVLMKHAADLLAEESKERYTRTKSSLKLSCDQGESATRKSVNFDSIEIREHSIELGDHPSVSDGVPLTLGWNVQKRSSFDLDKYEASRERGGKTPRRISADQRAIMLLSEGHSIDEFVDATLEIRRIKEGRSQSVKEWTRKSFTRNLIQFFCLQPCGASSVRPGTQFKNLNSKAA